MSLINMLHSSESCAIAAGMSEDATTPAWLETPAGVRVPLSGDCSLGRSSENDIVINDPNVSRRHALIQMRSKGIFWIVDLGAKNGVIVNDNRVGVAKPLKNGDTIRIGDAVYAFRQAPRPTDSERFSIESIPPTNVKIDEMECWLLVADVKGWARLSQGKSQPEAEAILTELLDSPRAAIGEAGGKVDKNLGDGFLAFWRAHDCPPEKLAGILSGLRRKQAETGNRYRLVLHRGVVSIGQTLTPGEELQSGDEINYVFRIEELASTENIEFCVSAEAQRHLAPFVETRLVGSDFELRNLPGLHSIHRLR